MLLGRYSLCLAFSHVPSSPSRLSSPGKKEGEKAQGKKKEKMKLKLAIVRFVIMLNSIIIIQATQETVLQGLVDIWE